MNCSGSVCAADGDSDALALGEGAAGASGEGRAPLEPELQADKVTNTATADASQARVITGKSRQPSGHSDGTCACSRAASGPSANNTLKPSSSRTGTFRETALSYLEPGESPTTTKPVFFDTEPETLPPSF